MTSLSILRSPYWLGNPFVLETLIVVSIDDTVLLVVVLSTITSGFKLSNFKYWSKLSLISIGPPWYSWEI